MTAREPLKDLLVDEDDLARERARARELRRSQWWKNQRARGVCYYCKRRFPARELTMDHIVPLVRGGRSTRSNVVPACAGCNRDKRSRLPLEWQDDADAE